MSDESSWMLELHCRFGKWFLVLFLVFDVFTLGIKTINYHGNYEIVSIVCDWITLICFIGVENLRRRSIQHGNKCCIRSPLIVSFALLPIVILFSIYFYAVQTYVFIFEETMIIIYWIFLFLQTVGSISAFRSFS
ncbi:unnamed protein product [Oikopleura dioica]|uniref:Transmembrane protein n=2 Tax=Oikopleura dioica TaxID=34765 RepID=E4X8T4_OIKDI|nr:unnamed protein product [Oikopleura dioica]